MINWANLLNLDDWVSSKFSYVRQVPKAWHVVENFLDPCDAEDSLAWATDKVNDDNGRYPHFLVQMALKFLETQ